MEGRQLALDLFAQLDEAVRLPEEMSVSELLGRLERTLMGMPRSQQMAVAGEALTQLVGAFAERAELLRFFLNHRTFMRSQCPERVGKSPAELMTGQPHSHWLELLGFERFRRNPA
ncbi:hypothetical protein [Synechococcus sp. PCC 7336]|uniref:hypothetical protein n=1 Tax=Synechococcus sp. PCC 7336 TaxID=195250 RepID=UPI0003488B7A|nr:hypothetical protein [Synechococcus sp. PCC 7336]